MSLIAALPLTFRRNRIGLNFGYFSGRRITRHAGRVLRNVLQHLRGRIHVDWDRGNTHKGPAIRR